MIIPKSLLHGSIAFLVCSSGTALVLQQRDNISFLFSGNPHSYIYKLGLNCGKASVEGSECQIYPGRKILVKKEDDSFFEVNALGGGAIKLYRVEGSTYKKGFKFSIENNDIAGSGENNKLKEMETYGIERFGGKYHLSRKRKAEEEIKNSLGLSCNLPTNGSPEDCDISGDKLNRIKFVGKGNSVTLEGGTTKLSISGNLPREDYPLGYRFTFKNTGNTDSTLTISDSKSMVIKNGIDVDFRIKKEGTNLSLENWTIEALAEKVGLKKEGDDWNVKDGGVRVKQDSEKKFGNLKRQSGYNNGKIKAQEGAAGHHQGFKFSIEDNDITLRDEASNTNVTLGQSETYEISRDNDGTWYLSRVKDSRQEIKDSLSLPCDLPGDNQDHVECSGDIKGIKFEGNGSIETTGAPKLTIHREDLRQHYPFGYKFVFTSSNSEESSLSVGSVKTTLKENMDIDFRIKKSENKMTLEKAWTPDALMEELKFKKNSDWWELGDGTMNIKQGDKKSDNLTKSGAQTGKIKVHEGVPGYNQGFKFVIEDGNLGLDNTESIGALSKYETYEASKDNDGDWYFTRKQNSSEVIREKLGIPTECKMPSHSSPSEDCTSLTQEKLKSIGFKDKGANEAVTISGGDSITLKISRTDSTDFPLGYRFTLVSDKEITIPQTSGSISIKANTNTEFKIKETGSTLTLEKAWTPQSLGGKLKMNCNGSGDSKCTLGNSISVYDGEGSHVVDATITSAGENKKLIYQENVDNHNQGIKFTPEEAINLGGGIPSGNGVTPPTTIAKENVTYEIMEKSVNNKTKWYLVKKEGN